jgi:hypothetical protein
VRQGAGFVVGGYDRKHGVRLRIRPPGSSPDSAKLLASGRADVRVLDIHDLGIARERGTGIVAVAALVQRLLAAINAGGDIARRREFEGRTVGGSPPYPEVALVTSRETLQKRRGMVQAVVRPEGRDRVGAGGLRSGDRGDRPGRR